ncbi:MAG TPA: hypothetical protein PKM44_08925 [Turneriella sp.]|nr:hypothetical protein [Turneriella sp.]HNJ64679.1 hypothetical protein [Turneriella sp.]HNL10621.1 hypothetical protein [Turneriella sp.]HNL53834.1 hypothetical protein [Turneriella sp.]
MPRKALQKKHQKLLSHSSHVGLAIDGYDDLFSDFDPRPYHERELSEDFLTELRRFFYHKSPEYLDIVLLVPAKRRRARDEDIVKKRLHIYFQKKYRETKKSLKHTTLWNLLRIFLAMSIMILTGFLAVHAGQVLWRNILKVMLEPASWWLFWTSFDNLLAARKKVNDELQYFHRLAECKIVFLPR